MTHDTIQTIVAAVISAASAVYLHRKQVQKVMTVLLEQEPPRDQGSELRWAARWLGAVAVPAARVLLETGDAEAVDSIPINHHLPAGYVQSLSEYKPVDVAQEATNG